MRTDGRVEPGQRIDQAFSARAWNRAQDAADVILGGHVPPGIADPVGVRTQSFVPILIQNTLSTGVDRWGCLSIAGIAIAPSGTTGEATRSFEATPLLRGGLPTAGEAFVVPLEPIAASGIGRAAVAGVVAVRLEVVDAGHEFAGPKDGSTTGLKSGSDGPTEILWKESGTGTKWGLVRFGGPASAQFRMGTYTGAWDINTTQVVSVSGSTGINAATASVLNSLFSVGSASGPRSCAIASDGVRWHLVNVQHGEQSLVTGVTLATTGLVFGKIRTFVLPPVTGASETIAVDDCTGATG